MTVPTLPLHGGHKIPVVGYGTAGRGDVEVALEAALEAGYRHIDTAFDYGNEEKVGKVLKKWIDSGKIKREELFVVTKLTGSANTPERVEAHLKISLERLQLDYVDLYLIHHAIWLEPLDPNDRAGGFVTHPTDHIALWKKMEEQVDAGRTKAIGVSNFSKVQVERLLKVARIKPAALQVEVHIYLQQDELVNYCQDNGVVVIAYSPLGSPGRTEYKEESGLPKSVILDPTIAKIAEKYKKTVGQIMLRFLIQRNIVVIPKSSTPHRIKENFDVLDFALKEEDFKTIRGLEVGEKARISFGIPKTPETMAHPEWAFPRNVTYHGIHRNAPPPRKAINTL